MNIMITSEEYNEYEAQKEKIKELEARNEFLKNQYDLLNEKYQALSKDLKNQRDENEAQKEKFDIFYSDYLDAIKKCNELKKQVDHWKMQFESTFENYQQALSNKAAIIKERNEYKDLYMKQIIKTNELRFENDELKNKDTRFKELVTENYRLKMSVNDLRANNKELKAKIKEPVAAITINPCRDSDEEYSPDNNTNIKIENLYITNNYFSEEDEDNGCE